VVHPRRLFVDPIPSLLSGGFWRKQGKGCYRCDGGHRTHITPAKYCRGGDEEALEHDGHSEFVQEPIGLYEPPALLGTSE
jgi:hypothetical protein